MSGESLRGAGKLAKNLGGFGTPWLLATVALWTFSCSPENGGEAAPGSQGAASQSSAPLNAADQWAQVSRVEELVLRLDAQLSELAFAVRNLELPDERTRRQFAPLGLVIEDLAPGPAPIAAELASIGSRARIDPPAPLQREVFAPDLRLWRPLLESVDFFEHAKLQIKRGRFVPDSQPEEFEAQLVFSARARMASGELASFAAMPSVRWRLIGGADAKRAESWRIVEWRTGPMKRLEVAKPLFREVLDEALTDPTSLSEARLSVHERWIAKEVLARRAKEDYEPPYPLFYHTAVSKHPAMAVVDLDRDGFDDIYLITRWGPNRFYRNRGDGTFEEISARLGLDIDGFSNAGIFADFDNDGDADLFLGKSIEPSLYLVNEDGRFVDRSAKLVTGPMPSLVSSLSAADVDGDGLLDVYVATYAAQLSLAEIKEQLDPTAYEQLLAVARKDDERPFTSVSGPPNVLLRNAGDGRFEVVRNPGALATLRNTYQATWADFDRDGDPDVYLANDFAPDNMIRNDGDGKFVDVTEELGFTRTGFGMGVTWGDYDRDGHEDLYVANMFSKAGTRITSGLDYLDPSFGEAAEGNFLYRNEPEGFRLVSGSGESELRVHQAGWSWGTHFLDADNDGFLDLYALAGFYTAPAEVAKAGDT